jgi:hypothetical protein
MHRRLGQGNLALRPTFKGFWLFGDDFALFPKVLVLPITHSPPLNPADAIEIPTETKKRLGLDTDRGPQSSGNPTLRSNAL